MTRHRFGLTWLLAAAIVSVGARGSEAGADGGLPEVLVEFPGGRLERSAFLALLIEAVGGNPGSFDVPDGFITAEMLRRERERLGIPPPDPLEADERVARMEREAGGAEMLRAELVKAQLTPRDLWRLSLRDAECFRVAQMVLRPPPRNPMTEAELDQLLAGLRRRYDPVWYGFGAPLRVATLSGGHNLTQNELLEHLVREGPDLPMREVFEFGLTEAIEAALLKRLGVDPKGAVRTLAQALNASVTEDDVAAFYEQRYDDMRIAGFAWIFLPYPDNEIQRLRARSDAPPPPAEIRNALMANTMELRADLVAGRFTFDDAVIRRSGDTGSRMRKGVWGYVPRAEWVVEALDPAAWRLDHFKEDNRRVSPVRRAPDPVIEALLPEMTEDQLSDALELREGYALVKRLGERPPPPEAAVRSDLRRWLVAERERTLRAEMRDQARILWSPMQSR